MEARLNNLTQALKKHSIDSVFMTSKENVFYFTNLYAEAHERLIGAYMDQKGNRILIAPALEKEDVKNAGWNGELITYFDHENPWDKLSSFIKDIGHPQSMAIEKEDLNVLNYETLKNQFPKTEMVNGQHFLNELRLIKDHHEMKILKEAAQYADFGIETALKHIQAGKTELDIIAEIEYAMKKEGIRDMSFGTTVLTGKKSAAPHGNPDLTPIQKSDFVLMDLGVVHKGYCSDITRTVVFGEASEQQKGIYHTVLQAEQKAIEACQVGTRLGDIDQVARQVIKDAGYGEYFPHRIGHGLGINVHEFPSLASNNDSVLQEGMSFTVEPGIYVPEVGGVRIEDDVFITGDGPTTLTEFIKELIEL
ncbi:M24 family metallopeptidase [Tenuibacillus multivorans]|uniref:Xaa-Pro dipeptidase n=1 Tax=Tenuibacillus multivorans TaxID=237069 RepID=A0A1G9ZVR6_9BACI|nr:Xaa-Pro peptidase family protein [Tenuibacillus multivorans]GEL76866.1 Xaa-Pro dipeptidase [Tenuibacillus multivorans]SDN25194.1 Xaa-Pro dipeptidase [Tenuibacillus multivorans]